MPTRDIKGYSVEYSEDSKFGLDYLSGLTYEDIKAFFAYVTINGSKTFDSGSHGYKVTPRGGSMPYTISKKY